MSLSIHTNFASMVAQNGLARNNNMLSTAMERLGTGFRVNSAADDAAGLQIANRLTAQSRGMVVAQRNSMDAISMLQTADGALDEIASIAFRMKDLATQSANGTNSAEDREALDAEYQQLADEVERIMLHTTYGGAVLLEDGLVGEDITFQIGASENEQLEFVDGGRMGEIADAYGAMADIETAENAETALGLADALIETVGEARAAFGATINRLEHTINNLASIQQNVEAATGRIMDADFAVETSNMTKQQMLMQSGISVLGNANQLTGLVASLLR